MLGNILRLIQFMQVSIFISIVVKFKIVALTFRALHGLAPAYNTLHPSPAVP